MVEVTLEELRSIRALKRRFKQAVSEGYAKMCQADWLRFVTSAVYCLRAAEHPGAMFTANLTAGRWFGTQDDEDRARAMIRDDQPPGPPPAPVEAISEALNGAVSAFQMPPVHRATPDFRKRLQRQISQWEEAKLAEARERLIEKYPEWEKLR